MKIVEDVLFNHPAGEPVWIAYYHDGTHERLSFELLTAYQTVYRNIPNRVTLLHEHIWKNFRVVRTEDPNKPFAISIYRD